MLDLEVTAQREPDAIAAANYPEPVEHCDVCRWWSVCDKRRRADDHLSLVAGVSRLQSRELQAAGVATLAQLGELPLPLSFTPRRGAIETYVRVREQARLQLAGRTQGAPVHELLPITPDQGFARLPAPSPGDVFLDLEGDPFARDGGREYLFGFVTVAPDGTTSACAFWASSDSEERAAFEAVVDEILQSWAANSGMHVYHYAPYEPAAFKRLMGRYATREAEVDRMLRAGCSSTSTPSSSTRCAPASNGTRSRISNRSTASPGRWRSVTHEPICRVIERALELGAHGCDRQRGACCGRRLQP